MHNSMHQNAVEGFLAFFRSFVPFERITKSDSEEDHLLLVDKYKI